MENSIRYTSEHPTDFNGLLSLYESLGWNSLKLTVNELERMCKQSWYAIYVFDDKRLVGMGRVISNGVITGIIFGVLPKYQSSGIGKEIVKRLIQHCEQNKVIPQLMCVEKLQSYYESIGFEAFSIGMTKHIIR
ncbi:GNAT family N-acetyltransferase [Bacillus cereus]|uniref:GNAT family N-acetyltransferase n=1 Tax=Bacillus cereus TaxID=1396 RepID=UPI000BEB3114|nr:GNAT family N-acetyltransferase [Bacillus cereus]PEE40283.1 GNAT family N-acetyltransferase [Bacillus cereus]PET49328.1 GNAT family N-acetyltransferase [Bacillus cereus]PFA41132.1 GNAT family N-acetyltransferase [Bacillus cereus]PFD66861.1 GNAT family N-acetyltransferase [Bacillus cereus]PFE68651.1 GNAT family N-acetyltransferase [Bacillus cereus]